MEKLVLAEVNDWTVFGQTECHVWFLLSPVKKDMSYFALENLTKVNLFFIPTLPDSILTAKSRCIPAQFVLLLLFLTIFLLSIYLVTIQSDKTHSYSGLFLPIPTLYQTEALLLLVHLSFSYFPCCTALTLYFVTV